jgi:hypothetical protein
MKKVKCSLCGRKLEYMGVTIMEQWRGNICVPCKLVFCPKCIEIGRSSPCPKCGQGTSPALLIRLEQAGVL